MILVTGAGGFVGAALVAGLRRSGVPVRAGVREGQSSEDVVLGDLAQGSGRLPALEGFDCIVHAAARVHMVRDPATDPLARFRAVNVEGTLRLAEHAVRSGVRRFVFMSSVKVHGEATSLSTPFRASDPLRPADPYARSKAEAEDRLSALCSGSRMELVVVRPPLVYGPGVAANFERMIRLVRSGIPLPFGSVRNARSMVFVGNLVDLVSRCVLDPVAAGERFLVSDGEDLSTPDLVRALARAMGRPTRLVPVPPAWLRGGAALVGRNADVDRLVGSLRVDDSETRARLGWDPPVPVAHALALTVGAGSGNDV